MKIISIKSFLTLIKYKVSLAVTFTAATGYLVYSGCFDLRLINLIGAVFILAGGSSALNQVQERKYDELMERTKFRPLPSKLISPQYALLLSVLLILTGLIYLYFAFGTIPALLGLFNIVWYNLLYTNLKRISAFAVVPGSLVGAIPVFIGWTAAGGYLFELSIVFIAFFLFIWQIPHFWLLMIKYGDQYEKAGFPTINQSISIDGLKKIIFSWVVATSVFSIAIPLFLRDLSWNFFLIVFLLNFTFVFVFARLSFGKVAEPNLKKSFISINVYMILFMGLLILYHLS